MMAGYKMARRYDNADYGLRAIFWRLPFLEAVGHDFRLDAKHKPPPQK